MLVAPPVSLLLGDSAKVEVTRSAVPLFGAPAKIEVPAGLGHIWQTAPGQDAAPRLDEWSQWAQPSRTGRIFGPLQDEVVKRHDLRCMSFASTATGLSVASSASLDDSDSPSVDSPGSAIRQNSFGLDPVALAEALKRSANAGGGTPRTTLKLSNIPRRCGKEELLAAIDAVGFGDTYDFFYLPLGPQSKKNHGYAFINFKSNETADRFTKSFAGYPIRAKVLEVAPAPLQGLALNIENFAKTHAAKCDWAPNVVLKV